MAELIVTERLQPSLLDRLTDDEPDKQIESRDRRVLSMRGLRQAVLRDLTWLFNTINLVSLQPTLGEWARKSTVNYGIPDLAGKAISGFKAETFESSIRQAIWDFEPRLIRNTVRVEVQQDQHTGARHNIVKFKVEGDLWALPYPERLYLKTELDLESGSISLNEQR